MIRPAAALICAAMTMSASLASAEPILKPHKYYGPIPQSALALRIGMLGGAENTEMIDFLDGRLQPPFEALSDDFGNGLAIDIGYMHKPHPRFGFRVNGTYTALRSTGSGTFVPQSVNPGDSLLTAVSYSRNFDVDLMVIELSGVYYFADASVKDFQTYAGGGFTFGFPHEKFKEDRIDQDTGLPYGDPIDLDEWGFSAGVHAVLGLLYYVSNQFGISAEGRLQLMEGRFDQLQTPNEVGDLENVNFVIDYTGFYATLGFIWAF
ncbi:MAG TPA: hypothetical protein VFX92_01830 [Candidatus Krumholzibacteria bacterium]|nr:hypothetical protein [Candidatus Krumholzibacteria bacterium]